MSYTGKNMLLLPFVAIILFFKTVDRRPNPGDEYDSLSFPLVIQDSLKKQALKVLDEKCNVCHITKRKVQNFTFQNMDSLALEVNNQVFIKERMPKGRKIVLTHREKEILRLWIKRIGKK